MEKSTLVLSVAAALALGCGSGDPEGAGATEPMGAPAGMSQGEARGANSAPVIESVRFQPERPRRGRPVRAVAEVRDDDGDRIRLAYVWTLDGERVPGDAQVALPHSRKGDRIEVRVTASDGREESRPVVAETRVYNQPPTLRGLQIEPANRITAGDDISVRPAAEDADGDAIAYRYTWWVNDETVDTEGPLLDTKRLRRGDRVRVRAVASDGQDESEPITSQDIEVANAPPRIVSKPGPAGADGSFHYQLEVEDADDDRTLRYSLAKAPEGMTIGSVSGELRWRPGPTQAGIFPVEVVVEDLQGGRDYQLFDLTVNAVDAAADPNAGPAAPGS